MKFNKKKLRNLIINLNFSKTEITLKFLIKILYNLKKTPFIIGILKII